MNNILILGALITINVIHNRNFNLVKYQIHRNWKSTSRFYSSKSTKLLLTREKSNNRQRTSRLSCTAAWEWYIGAENLVSRQNCCLICCGVQITSELRGSGLRVLWIILGREFFSQIFHTPFTVTAKRIAECLKVITQIRWELNK